MAKANPPILRRFMEVFEVKTQVALARALGVSHSGISDAKKTGRYPEAWFERAYSRKRALKRYLQTGRLPKTEEPHDRRTLPQALQDALSVAEHLEPERHQELYEFAEFLRDADVMARDPVMKFIRLLRTLQLHRNPSAAPPLPPLSPGPQLVLPAPPSAPSLPPAVPPSAHELE